MFQRCINKKRKDFKNYGGRGIKVCEKWKDFYAFSNDMGPKPPGTTIERINNDGNYEPGNCRWATHREQTRNYRRNHMLTYNGRTQCITDWAAQFGIDAKLVFGRISKGWPVRAALTVPKQIHHSRRNGPAWAAAMNNSDHKPAVLAQPIDTAQLEAGASQ